MAVGYLSFVLHAHLPFVKHPEHEEFLEEDWLFEAITETYIPLIDVFDSLVEESIPFRMAMSLTPPLCEMLVDPLLQERYLRYITKRIALSEKEARRHDEHSPFREAAFMYEERYKRARYIFEEKYGRNLVGAFRRLQEQGRLEILTCAATHGFLPLMATQNSVRAQLTVARSNYEKHFGQPPRGIWLPECAYTYGLEYLLAEQGIDYFIIDAHGVQNADPRPRMGVFAPIYCHNGVAAFGRDLESSKQVWSSKEGYPGDYNYRDFYRDLGYDGDYEHVRPYLHADGQRRNLGIKYHRITGDVDLGAKQPYYPGAARDRAAEHAGNFMFNRQHQARFLCEQLQRMPIILAPYDAELYGHWWFEGPDFLNFLIRKIAFDQSDIAFCTPGDYLDANPVNQVAQPAPSSWGDKGYYEVWLNGSNDWIYRYLHKCEYRMIEIARRCMHEGGLMDRAAKQAARELLLAQSSDWAFIMTTGTMVPYAERRTKDHIHRFLALYDQIMSGHIDEGCLAELEWKDSIFQEINFRVYA
ncbi:MAG: DUF1957 domain-containing protein [Planctomycetes bacterium]|nr:DUF1957 domain-containing protein [Planctomycetota bacterium]